MNEKNKKNEKKEIKEVNNSEIKEVSYNLDDLLNNKELMNDVLSQLLDLVKKVDNEKEKEIIENEIKKILSVYNKEVIDYEIPLNKERSLTVYDQNKDLLGNDYVGFVYYFWSANTMNFKIIGLKNLYPIFDLVNTQEKYYLDKPTMITNDIPIYMIVKGIPFTVETEIRNQLFQLNQSIFENGYNADLISAMTKSSHWINVYGKDVWTFKFISFLFTLILSICLIEYIILFNIFTVK